MGIAVEFSRDDLETLFGHQVDLVMRDAVRNPHFRRSAEQGAEELYAA